MPTNYEWSYEEFYFDDFAKRVEDKQKEGWEVFSVQSDVCSSLGETIHGESGFRVIFRRAPPSGSLRWINQDQDGMI